MENKTSKLMQARDQRFRILKIHSKINFDPAAFEVLSLLFDWANRMGLEGKRVSALEISDEDFPDPLRVMKEASCCVWQPIEEIN